MANMCWYMGVVVVMSVHGGGVEGGGGRGGCNHPGEAWLRPIPTVRFRVGRGDNPNNFCRVHNMINRRWAHNS